MEDVFLQVRGRIHRSAAGEESASGGHVSWLIDGQHLPPKKDTWQIEIAARGVRGSDIQWEVLGDTRHRHGCPLATASQGLDMVGSTWAVQRKLIGLGRTCKSGPDAETRWAGGLPEWSCAPGGAPLPLTSGTRLPQSAPAARGRMEASEDETRLPGAGKAANHLQGKHVAAAHDHRARSARLVW